MSRQMGFTLAPLQTWFVLQWCREHQAKLLHPDGFFCLKVKVLGSNKFPLFEIQHRSCFWQALFWALFCNKDFLFLQQTAVTVTNCLLVKVCPSLSQQNRFLLAWNLTKPNRSQELSLQENVVRMERRSLISKNRIIVCPKFTNGVFKCVSTFLKTHLVSSCGIV